MSQTLLLVIELIGIVSFAISGAMTAIKKNMDIFGVAILGLTTAVGGGVIRDLILGKTPPATFQSPIYAVTAIVTSLIFFIPAVRHFLNKKPLLYDIGLLVMDSIGLGVFTVVGIKTAFSASDERNIFLFVFVGVVTGVGGGVLRDLLAGNTPYIFVKHFYASASLVGAIATTLLWQTGETVSMSVGAALVIILRLLAARFHWSLPKAHL